MGWICRSLKLFLKSREFNQHLSAYTGQDTKHWGTKKVPPTCTPANSNNYREMMRLLRENLEEEIR